MRCVFIGGCPRSGTTLLGSMVGNHPSALAVPEAPFLPRLARILDEDEGDSPTELAGALHATLVDDPRFRLWQTPLDRDDLAATVAESPDLGSVITHLAVAFARARGLDESAEVVVGHSPDSIRHAGVLRRHLPSARFVHIVRDGRGVYASFRDLDWGPATVLHGARLWLQELTFGLALEIDGGCTRIRYEDVLTDAPATMPRVAEALDLPYDEALLSSADDFLPAYTRAQHRRVGGDVDTSRADGWRSVLDPREVEVFEALTFDVLDLMGYERDNAHPRGPSRSEAARFKAENVVRTRQRKRRQKRRLAAHS